MSAEKSLLVKKMHLTKPLSSSQYDLEYLQREPLSSYSMISQLHSWEIDFNSSAIGFNIFGWSTI